MTHLSGGETEATVKLGAWLGSEVCLPPWVTVEALTTLWASGSLSVQREL